MIFKCDLWKLSGPQTKDISLPEIHEYIDVID